MKKIYLDYAAATPLDEEVFKAMQPYLTERFYNPSATYLAAKAVTRDIEAARVRVAHWLGARPSEIIFTAGGTEANNLAIQGIMDNYPDCSVVTSSIEHDSVLKPAGRYEHRLTPVQPDGLIDLESLGKAIDDKTVLVSIIYANNEIGTIQPLRRIRDLCDEIKKDRQERGIKRPLYLHSDAAQAGNYLDLHVSRLGVDMLTLNGGKIYGPKQSGVLFVKSGIILNPLIVGGGQENNLRSGTENVAAIIGLATALDRVQTIRHEETARLQVLTSHLMSELGTRFPGVIINGSLKHRLPNNVHVTFPGQDNERLMMALDEAGIQCAVGSACSASSDEPSHVLKAIGLSDEDARSSLRFTLGRYTKRQDINSVLSVLARLLA